jgi:hypothetical protein
MDLQPCPKCGRTELKQWESVYLGSTVQCKGCGWREPSGLWNTRSDPRTERLKIAVGRALAYMEREGLQKMPCYGELDEALRLAGEADGSGPEKT